MLTTNREHLQKLQEKVCNVNFTSLLWQFRIDSLLTFLTGHDVLALSQNCTENTLYSAVEIVAVFQEYSFKTTKWILKKSEHKFLQSLGCYFYVIFFFFLLFFTYFPFSMVHALPSEPVLFCHNNYINILFYSRLFLMLMSAHLYIVYI